MAQHGSIQIRGSLPVRTCLGSLPENHAWFLLLFARTLTGPYVSGTGPHRLAGIGALSPILSIKNIGRLLSNVDCDLAEREGPRVVPVFVPLCWIPRNKGRNREKAHFSE
jgi:hypothetical protein